MCALDLNELRCTFMLFDIGWGIQTGLYFNHHDGAIKGLVSNQCILQTVSVI